MQIEFLAVTYGLGSALVWGAGDFTGGIATKKNQVFAVVLFSQIVGALFMISLGLLFSESIPEPIHLVWGAIGGVFGALGLVALYSALSSGSMGIVAPLSAVVSSILPIFFAFYFEGVPATSKIIGFAFAIGAVWFLSYPGKSGILLKKELTLAFFAGIGFGLFFIFIDKASENAVIWPLLSAKSASIVVNLAIFVLQKPCKIPGKNQLLIIAVTGVFDAIGNALFALATQLGRLDVSSVLASLYPASTVLLAWIILKERLNLQQWIGVGAALGALILIAA